MNSLKYLESNPSSKKFTEHSMSLHKRNLIKIKSSKANLINPLTPEITKQHKLKKHFNFKEDSVYIENMSLLERLISLSQEKLKPKRMLSEESTRPNKQNITKSRRMKESAKIIRENKQFASRISGISPALQASQFKKEYLQHLQYRSNLSKYDDSQKAIRKVKLEPFSKIPSRENFSQRENKNNYLNSSRDLSSKKSWKVVSLANYPDSNYLMAIPIAL